MKNIASLSQKFNVDLAVNKINKFDQQWYQIVTPSGVADLKSVTTILSMAHPIDAGLIQWMKREGRNADLIRDEAAQLGTHVHKLIELTLSGAEITFEDENKNRVCTLDEWEVFLHWCDWYQEMKQVHDLKPLHIEQIVFNIEEGIAGTVDLIAGTDEGTMIFDWKTGQLGNGNIQVSKYLDMANKMGMYGEIKRAAIVQLGNGLNKKGWRMTEITNIDYHIKTFNLDLELFNRVYPDFKPKYKEYPNVVSLAMLDAVPVEHSEKEIEDARDIQQEIKKSRMMKITGDAKDELKSKKVKKTRKPRARKVKS
jgi:hypothetical protein